MELGGKVRYYREVRELSRDELAKRCGLSSSYIAGIESGGRSNLPINTLKSLSQALGVRMSDLLDDDLSSNTAILNSLTGFLQNPESVPYLFLAKDLYQKRIPLSHLEKAVEVVQFIKGK